MLILDSLSNQNLAQLSGHCKINRHFQNRQQYQRQNFHQKNFRNAKNKFSIKTFPSECLIFRWQRKKSNFNINFIHRTIIKNFTFTSKLPHPSNPPILFLRIFEWESLTHSRRRFKIPIKSQFNQNVTSFFF